MQDYIGLYRKHRDRPPQKIREWCNPQAEAKHVHLGRVTLRDWTASRQWCQIRTAQHRATDGGEYAHERQATYAWERCFGYFRTVEEYRHTIFFSTHAVRLSTAREARIFESCFTRISR